jgi:ubiquinol-cytochrome c reductase iron-sulfur subunit
MSGTDGHATDHGPDGAPHARDFRPGEAPVPGPGETAEPARAPYRVIGTPPPAEERTLLGAARVAPPPSAESTPLPTDPEDQAAAKRNERLVATLFILSMVAGIGFIAAYIGLEVGTNLDAVWHSNLALGLSMAVAFLALGAGAVIWVRTLMPDVQMSEERKPLASPESAREEFAETFKEGAEASQFVKRPILRRTLIAATVPLGIAPIVLLRDMGPLPGTSLRHTVWRKGLRLVIDQTGQPVRPADFDTPGSMITVIPEGYQDNDTAIAKAAVIIIKFEPGQLQPKRPGSPNGTVMNWTVDNIVAYSKICTHVGCPVALYEHTTHHILCPCHQSTFDATDGAAVLFGPASRPLPQLPMGVDAEGYLISTHDFYEPVGPSFWERGAVSEYPKGTS